MGRCIIVLPLYAGEERALVTPGPKDLLLCADGGYDRAVAFGLRPSLVIGDFDSMPESHVRDCAVVRVPREKDDGDGALCVREGRARGCGEFVLAGGVGGRLDHTLALLQTMADCALRGETAVVTGAGNVARMLMPGRYELARHDGWKLSLLAWNGDVTGLTMRGVKYPLTDYQLMGRCPLGLSNEWVEDTATISFETGLLLAVRARDESARSR